MVIYGAMIGDAGRPSAFLWGFCCQTLRPLAVGTGDLHSGGWRLVRTRTFILEQIVALQWRSRSEIVVPLWFLSVQQYRRCQRLAPIRDARPASLLLPVQILMAPGRHAHETARFIMATRTFKRVDR